MPDYSSPIYDLPRQWIRNKRARNMPWENILLANKADDDSLRIFLDDHEEDDWPHLENSEWKEIVRLQKEASENIQKVEHIKNASIIIDDGQDNDVTVPSDPSSCWQLYRTKLKKDGFQQETIDEIERATLRILKRLSRQTMKDNPVKGLVIGNVQSGKTANMAALMAMSADWGWNMFVILSGTIENLRKQTQTRLYGDLSQPGNISWRSLEHLQRNMSRGTGMRAQELQFSEGSCERYFTVCLKNPGRLRNLIRWAQEDPNSQKQMRMLVIDDEADQAGINTAKIDQEDRRTINRLICNLVNGNDENGNASPASFMAMNYIGYTATPYANILNEAGRESLYPRNFISTLSVSDTYFGPQQIFGYAEDSYEDSISGHSLNFPGMDIVREVTDEELGLIKNIHDGDLSEDCDSLLDAVCWFLCGVSCMRLRGHKKPVSMLVHTSQKTQHHKFVALTIEQWFSKTSPLDILARCKNVWDREIRFDKAAFKKQYPSYGIPDNDIFDYPSFTAIESEIKAILDSGLTKIELDSSTGQLVYHNGVHLCIDNCTNNGIDSEGKHIRLAYPESGSNAPDAAAFIVVGGATLSRGLTLEGLISTFFIRSVRQADTLMQMGRWFGYRKDYELLPRIWMTITTRNQFEFLAKLDQELRDEILRMDICGISPAEYGPQIKNSPMVSFIRITAANRMQSAEDTELDFRGASNQTYLFDNDKDILEKNISLTEDFIRSLGAQTIWDDGEKHHENAAVWKGVAFNSVRTFFSQFHFQSRLSVFNDPEPLLDWIGHMTDIGNLSDWNVAVCGKKDSANGTWELPNGTIINKVSRSRVPVKNESDANIISIGALRNPSDLFADINFDDITNAADKVYIKQNLGCGNSGIAMGCRDKSGLDTTPQLLIYRVDMHSRARSTGSSGPTRTDLNAPCDIIGLCIYIPGGKINRNYVATVSINMGKINGSFAATADLEGTDAD